MCARNGVVITVVAADCFIQCASIIGLIREDTIVFGRCIVLD